MRVSISAGLDRDRDLAMRYVVEAERLGVDFALPPAS
jgi:hypothetical protein